MRLRDVDKKLLDQATVLDSDDQHRLIDELRQSHSARSRVYRKCVLVLLLVQLVAIALLQGRAKHSSPRLLLCFVSLLFLLASVYGTENIQWLHQGTWRIARVTNLLVAVYLVYDFCQHPVERALCALPAVNWIAAWLYRDHLNAGMGVENLEKSRYKLKTV